MAFTETNPGALASASGARDGADDWQSGARHRRADRAVCSQPGEAERITRALGGRWYGSYGMAFCPAHDNTRTPALSLREGRGGRLLAKCFNGCSFAEIIAAFRGRGLQAAGRFKERHTPEAEARRKRIAAHDRQQKIAAAAAIWSRSESIMGSLGEAYLCGRAIRCPLTATLRFLPALRHPSGARFPAMVAKVEMETGGEFVGVHRTYLDPAGGKAPVENAKMMLGPCCGGAVRLSAGAGPLVVCEGIETGLSLLDSLGGSPRVWAALSTSGLKRLALPETAGELILAPDGDGAGRLAAKMLAARARRAGWSVTTMDAPDGMDWNDVAREEAHGL